MNAFNELLGVIRLAKFHLERIKVPVLEKDIFISLLYFRILDFSENFTNLAQQNLSPGIFNLVVRNILESSAKQELLIKSPSSLINLQFEEIARELEIIHAFSLEKDPQFISGDGQIYLTNLRETYRKLTKQNVKTIGPKEIFQIIGAIELHSTLYKHLCQSAHSAMNALTSEYSHTDSERVEFCFEPFPKKSLNEIFPHVHSVGIFLLVSSIHTHEYFKTKLEGDFRGLYETFKEITT